MLSPSMETDIMDATSPRAADLLARRLYEAGCRHAFGMPGGEVLTIVDALEAAGIAFHLCKHENAAGFMAEGTYHRTGKPGTGGKTSCGILRCCHSIDATGIHQCT